eukprot:4642281-Lingulodinium_polyedra.AAC.1
MEAGKVVARARAQERKDCPNIDTPHPLKVVERATGAPVSKDALKTAMCASGVYICQINVLWNDL